MIRNIREHVKQKVSYFMKANGLQFEILLVKTYLGTFSLIHFTDTTEKCQHESTIEVPLERCAP